MLKLATKPHRKYNGLLERGAVNKAFTEIYLSVLLLKALRIIFPDFHFTETLRTVLWSLNLAALIYLFVHSFVHSFIHYSFSCLFHYYAKAV